MTSDIHIVRLPASIFTATTSWISPHYVKKPGTEVRIAKLPFSPASWIASQLLHVHENLGQIFSTLSLWDYIKVDWGAFPCRVEP